MDRNQDPVPESWRLIRKFTLTPSLCSEGCRRAALPGRSIKSEEALEGRGGLDEK